MPNVYNRPQGPVLDGIHLDALGMGDVDETSTENMAVRAAATFTPADLSELEIQQAKLVVTQEFPVVVMLACWQGVEHICLKGMADRQPVDRE